MQEFEYRNGSQSIQFTERDLDELCDQLLREPPYNGENALQQMICEGMSKRDLYLRVLPQAARRFGNLWDENEVSYLSVQLAMLRIEDFLESTRSAEPTKITQRTKKAILASIPGDTHTIGLKIAGDALRSNGWDIDLKTSLNYSKLMVEIDRSPASILILSIGSINSAKMLRRIVKIVRIVRPEIRIFVSGPLVAIDPKLFSDLKVDGLISNFKAGEATLDKLAKKDGRLKLSGH